MRLWAVQVLCSTILRCASDVAGQTEPDHATDELLNSTDLLEQRVRLLSMVTDEEWHSLRDTRSILNRSRSATDQQPDVTHQHYEVGKTTRLPAKKKRTTAKENLVQYRARADADVSSRDVAQYPRIEQHPYVVTIWLNWSTRPKYHGMGTLITPRHILTSAHTVTWKSGGLGPVPLDHHFIIVRVLCAGTDFAELDVESVVIHEQWQRKSRELDAAILKLMHKVDMAPGCFLVDFGSRRDLELISKFTTYTQCTVLVWQEQDTSESSQSGRLQSLQVQMLSPKLCNTHLINHSERVLNEDLEVCAAGWPSGEPCEHNAAWPLICEGKQMGVLSSGGDCVQRDVLVFGRTDVMRYWVSGQLTDAHQQLRLDDSVADNARVEGPLLWVLLVALTLSRYWL